MKHSKTRHADRTTSENIERKIQQKFFLNRLRQTELKSERTFSEEDMPQFIQITVICTKVINHTTDRLQQRTQNMMLQHTAWHKLTLSTVGPTH